MVKKTAKLEIYFIVYVEEREIQNQIKYLQILRDFCNIWELILLILDRS